MNYMGMGLGVALAVATGACGGTFEGEEMEDEGTATEAGALTYTAPVRWQQGQVSQGLGNVNNSVCFLTLVDGRFAGDGEWVGIFGVSPGAWHLGGASQQFNVQAAARCITGVSPSNYTNTQYWNQGEARVPLGRTVNGNFVQADSAWSCFMTHMQGRFDGFGEEIKTSFDDGKWWLTGKSQQVGVRGGAQCVRFPKRTTYSNVYPDSTPIMHFENPDTTRFACFLRGASGYFDGYSNVSTDLYSGPFWRLQARRNRTAGDMKAWGGCAF